MNDYRKIRVEPSYRKLRPQDTAAMHAESLAWLDAQLNELKGQKVVVVTHHGVSKQSVPPKYVSDPLQPAYTTELTEFIMDHPSKLWIHGHIHYALDYRIESTRIIANPRGYPNEQGHGFNPGMVVEV